MPPPCRSLLQPPLIAVFIYVSSFVGWSKSFSIQNLPIKLLTGEEDLMPGGGALGAGRMPSGAIASLPMESFSIPVDGAVGGPGGSLGFDGNGAGPVNDIIQTIEGLIGGGGAAIRILEQLVSRGRAAGGGELRVGLATGPDDAGTILGGFDISRDGAVRSRPATASGEAQSADFGNQDPYGSIADFLPLATSQRWLDEERLTQGRFTTQRLSDLTNHVINLLLPAARKTKQEAKDKGTAAPEEKDGKIPNPFRALRELLAGGSASSLVSDLMPSPRAESSSAPAEAAPLDTDAEMSGQSTTEEDCECFIIVQPTVR